MSKVNSPPISYILRDFHDVTVPESVSFWPQTVGWKTLVIFCFCITLYLLYRQIHYWWDNRYRYEALDAIAKLDIHDSKMPARLLSIIKRVLIHLDKHNARLFDGGIFEQLNGLVKTSPAFDADIAKCWLESMVNPTVELDLAQRRELLKCAKRWLKRHIERHDAAEKRTIGYQWRTIKGLFVTARTR